VREGESSTLTRRGISAAGLTEWASRAFGRISLIDRLTLGYLFFVLSLVLIQHERVQYWAEIALLHTALIALICWLAWRRTGGNRVFDFIGYWYPTLIFGFFFEEIGFIVHAVHPGWFDHLLIEADYAIFGTHPTVWIEQFANYWLTEWLQLAYTSYLFLTLGVGAYLWRRGNRRAFEVLIVSTCVAYYLGYLIFILFPIESPYHTLAHLQNVELTGGPFTALIEWIERYGRVHGGAFPSAHVSGATVALICAWRYARKWGIILTPLVLSIYVATVYGRYHYVVDVIAGIIMAIIGVVIGRSLVTTTGSSRGSGPVEPVRSTSGAPHRAS
jgi:membrane-associated phospholipid phosphatase